jgi:fructose-bisphosphate aldolase class II
MALVTLKTILDKAYREQYAVGSFNIVDLAFLEAIIGAARDQQSPVIISIAEAHFPFVTLENIVPLVHMIAAREQVDITLNLDHGLTIEGIEKALALGFTSIMFDGSTLDFEENVRQTREVVAMCRPSGVSVEAELGIIGGDEGGGLVGSADPALYTDVAQAQQFVKETEIDALAVAIGNSHGKYKGEPHLDFDRLETLRDETGIPLVLHGGSGISDADFRRAISLGIAKINFFTGNAQAALAVTRSAMAKDSETQNDYPLLVQQIKAAVSTVVAKQMRTFGSAGKAVAEE